MSTAILPEVAACLDALCKQTFVLMADMHATSPRDLRPMASAVTCRISIQDSEGAKSDLLLHADTSFARYFAQHVFETPSPDVTEEEVSDALKELANTLGGNLKGLVEAETSLSIPELLQGRHQQAAKPVARYKYAFADAGECMVELRGPLNN